MNPKLDNLFDSVVYETFKFIQERNLVQNLEVGVKTYTYVNSTLQDAVISITAVRHIPMSMWELYDESH